MLVRICGIFLDPTKIVSIETDMNQGTGKQQVVIKTLLPGPCGIFEFPVDHSGLRSGLVDLGLSPADVEQVIRPRMET